MRLFSLSIILFYVFCAHADPDRVAIAQFIEHPSLAKIRNGIIDAILAKRKDAKIQYKNAHGNVALGSQIAKKMASEENNVIIAITTPSAQAARRYLNDVPLVFAAVSDPYSAKVVLKDETSNVTGVYDKPLSSELLDFVLQIDPNIKRVGIIYNPGEANSVVFVEEITIASKKAGVEVITRAVSRLADIQSVTESLISDVDAIVLGNDNTVVSGIDAIIKICEQNSVPLFTSDPESVEKGAYAALAYDQYEIGRLTGELALRIINGEKAGDIPIEKPKKIVKVVNEKTANELKLPSKV